MNGKWTMMAVAASVVALAGCAQTGQKADGTMGSKAPPSECPDRPVATTPQDVCRQGGPACGIPIQVVADASGACTVRIGVDVLRMRRDGSKQPTEIFWWLAGSENWEFRNEAKPFTAPVIFKQSEAAKEFGPSRVRDGRAVYVLNSNATTGKFDYQIRVYNKTTGRPLESPDPAIYNDGP